MAILCMPAPVAAQAPDITWLQASNAWGALGLEHLESAAPVPAGKLTAAAHTTFYSTSGLFVVGDAASGQHTQLTVLWAPLEGFELGAGANYITSTYQTFGVFSLQTFGSPAVHLRYSRSIVPGLAVGLSAHGCIPTSSETGALLPKAYSAWAQAMASYHVAPWLEVSANVGYGLDNSRLQFNSRPTAQRLLALDVLAGNHLHAGLGALFGVTAGPLLLRPFLEVSGDVLGGTVVRASGGLKGMLAFMQMVELSVGADLRLVGTPGSQANVGGLPLWQGLVQLTAHFLIGSSNSTVNRSCERDSDCPGEFVCRQLVCTREHEVVRIEEVQRPTFVVRGLVLDTSTHARVRRDARLTVEGFDTPILADNTGAFTSWPLPARMPLILHVTAPGYEPLALPLEPGNPTEVRTLELGLKEVAVPRGGRVKGTVLDGRTGKPLAGATVALPALQKHVDANAAGFYDMQVPTGPNDLLISAPGHVTQRKRLDVDQGDVLQINVDLMPNKFTHRPSVRDK